MSVKPICPHYSFESPGTIFDEEAMTALELAARTARKVNECVEEVNHIPAKVAQDVNNHIVAGDFDKQIDKYSNEFGTDVTRRIDNILASGEQPSEVVDMRYQFDGKTAGSAGTAMREQFKILHRLENGAIFAGNNNPLRINKNPADGSVTAKFTSKLTIMVNGKEAVVSWDDLLANIPDHSTKDGDIVTITIPPYQALIHKDGDYALSIKGVKNLDALEIPLIINGWCEVLGGNLAMEWGLHNIHKQMANQAQTVYHTWPPRFELTPRYTHTDGKVYLRIQVDDHFTCMTADPTNRTRVLEFTPERVSELGAMYFVDGRHTIILAPYHILVYNVRTDRYAIRQYMDYIDPDDIVMMTTAWGTPLAGTLMDNYNAYQTYQNATTNAEPYKKHYYTIREYAKKCAEHSGAKREKFLFFTDPHLCHGEGWETLFNEKMAEVKSVFDASTADHVICGGDWLGNSDSIEDAYFKLGFVKAKMRAMFGDKFHMVIGNHDTNEQGTERIPDDTLDGLWFEMGTRIGCYAFDTKSTHFIMMNTGGEGDVLSPDITNAQVEWLARHLSELSNGDHDSPENIVLVLHMLRGLDPMYGEFHPLGAMLMEVCVAFNNGTPYTYGGKTYDMSGDYVGEVRFAIGGHIHDDWLGHYITLPAMVTTDLQAGGGATFDLIAVNYEDAELYSYRIGSGENRQMSIL